VPADTFAYWEKPAYAVLLNNAERHIEATNVKDSRTTGAYRRMIRLLKTEEKGVKRKAYDRVLRHNSTSYFIECLLYNVPDDVYDGPQRNSLRRLADWLVPYCEGRPIPQLPNGLTPLACLTMNPFFSWAAGNGARNFARQVEVLARRR
jgi:hypothetical protein